jgi:hypothetical protein
MDCLAGFDVSLEEGGAAVGYLSDCVATQDIADRLEAETDFVVSC